MTIVYKWLKRLQLSCLWPGSHYDKVFWVILLYKLVIFMSVWHLWVHVHCQQTTVWTRNFIKRLRPQRVGEIKALVSSGTPIGLINFSKMQFLSKEDLEKKPTWIENSWFLLSELYEQVVCLRRRFITGRFCELYAVVHMCMFHLRIRNYKSVAFISRLPSWISICMSKWLT